MEPCNEPGCDGVHCRNTCVLQSFSTTPSPLPPVPREADCERVEMVRALRNCRALALRNKGVGDWAHILRFCQEAGIVNNPLRSVSGEWHCRRCGRIGTVPMTCDRGPCPMEPL